MLYSPVIVSGWPGMGSKLVVVGEGHGRRDERCAQQPTGSRTQRDGDTTAIHCVSISVITVDQPRGR